MQNRAMRRGYGRRRRLLAALSAAQLATGCLGLAIALRRGHTYHWLFIHGDPARMRREAFTVGTGLSAPTPMLVAQLGATVLLTRDRHLNAARITLGVLGAMMVPGYLGESIVRRRLSRGGWHPIESPVAAGGLALAALMSALAWRTRDQ